MQRFTIPGQGGHLAAINFGRASGPIDLVFLHATGFCALTYRRLIEPLGTDHRTVAIDLRGHGLSTLPAHAARLTSWDTYARDVVAALRTLGAGLPPPRVLAGHSMGATVSMLTLARAPGLADALLMIDPPLVPARLRRWLLLPFAPRFWQRRQPHARLALRRRSGFPDAAQALASYRGRGAFRTWQEGFLEDYVEDGFAPQPDGSVRLRCAPAWESATFAAQRHDLSAALRALKTPGLMLVPETGATAERGISRVQAFSPGVRIERVPGTTHFLPMEAPEIVRQRILDLAARR